MKVKEPDLLEISKWFEMVLSQSVKADRKDIMKMRKKIRDELHLLLSWKNPTPKSGGRPVKALKEKTFCAKMTELTGYITAIE